MKIFIASPYTIGDVAQNVREGCLVAEKIRELGHLPFVPMLFHLWHLLSPHDYGYWTSMDNEWLYECEALLRVPGPSSGADKEVALAMKLGIPVYYSLDDLAQLGIPL